jgi:hypothetical protein
MFKMIRRNHFVMSRAKEMRMNIQQKETLHILIFPSFKLLFLFIYLLQFCSDKTSDIQLIPKGKIRSLK